MKRNRKGTIFNKTVSYNKVSHNVLSCKIIKKSPFKLKDISSNDNPSSNTTTNTISNGCKQIRRDMNKSIQ